MSAIHFYARAADGPDKPAGITVSKRKLLPTDGEFGLNEFIWGPVVLWFVEEDEFTADEREAAYHAFLDAMENQ